MWEGMTIEIAWEAMSKYFPNASAINGFFTGSFVTGIIGKQIERHLKKKDDKSSGERKILTKELENIHSQIIPVWRSATTYYGAPSKDGVALAQKIKSDLKQIGLQWTNIKASLQTFAPEITIDNQLLLRFRQAVTYGLDSSRDMALPLDDPRHASMEESAQELANAVFQACIKLA